MQRKRLVIQILNYHTTLLHTKITNNHMNIFLKSIQMIIIFRKRLKNFTFKSILPKFKPMFKP